MRSEEFDFDLFFPCLCNLPILVHAATAGGNIPEQLYEKPSHATIRAILKGPSNKIRFNYKLTGC